MAQAEALDRIHHTLPSKALEWGHHSVKFSQFCGLIAIGKDSIEILPKIYGKESDYGSCREVLIKMLYTAKWLKPQKGGSGSINLQKHHLLDVFILQFCEELFMQLRQGMIKRYVTQTDNLQVLRGKLLIDRQFKHNIAHKERVYCEYDELIVDNPHNQIIKYVLRLLLRVAYAGVARKKLTELLYGFEAVQDKPFIKDDAEKLQLNRSINRFHYVFEQCKWFLAGLNPDVVSGEHQSLVLLFDMNRLFEEFIAHKLEKVAWQKGYRLRTQGPQKYLAVNEATDEKNFMMKPDITVMDGKNKITAILDTKWKLLDATNKKKNISQADLYQMISYATRYQCNILHLIYPAQTDFNSENNFCFLVPKTSLRIHIYAVDLAKNEVLIELKI